MTGKTVGCRNGMELRAYAYGSLIKVYIDNAWQLTLNDSSITTGKAGMGGWGMPTNNSMTNLQLLQVETQAPAAIDASTIGMTAFPNGSRRSGRAWSMRPAGSASASTRSCATGYG